VAALVAKECAASERDEAMQVTVSIALHARGTRQAGRRSQEEAKGSNSPKIEISGSAARRFVRLFDHGQYNSRDPCNFSSDGCVRVTHKIFTSVGD